MTRITDIGRFLPLDENGDLVNDCIAEIQYPWSLATEFIKNEAKQAFQSILHGIYVRGSVARGLAIHGTSDLDIFVVLTQVLDRSRKTEWVACMQSSLIEKFPFCSWLDIVVVNCDALIHDDRGDDERFLIKTQSVCIFGEDLRPSLPSYAPDMRIAFGCHCLGKNIAKFVKGLSAAPDPNDRASWCEWVMRKLLRAAGEVAMLRTKRYSRDLFLCARAYAEQNPARMSDIEAALSLAISPRSEASVVLPIVHRLHQQLQVDIDIARSRENDRETEVE
jgi:predicted nucleotidyltransferase